MRRLCVLGLLMLPAPLAAQEKAAWPPPTLALYQQERAEALKAFTPAEVEAADALIAKATALGQAGNLTQAERLVRDARWQLPFKPTNLPEHVARVIGLGRLRHADRINALAYSPDGSLLASASRDGTVRLWDLGNGRQKLLYAGHSERKAGAEDRNPMRVPNVAFSPDGQTVASCGIREIHVWEAATGKRLATLAGHGAGEIRGLAFGAEANTVVSGGDDARLIIWDVKEQKPKQVFPPQANRVEAVAVSVKHQQIATVNAVGELHVYPLSASGGKALMITPITDGGQLGLGVAYAPELGILTCGGDNKAKLTGIPGPTGAAPTLRTFTGHTDKLNSLAVTPDGSLMVTGSNDRTVRVWEVATGKNLFTFQGHTAAVTAIAIRPDGKQAASASIDGSIRLWPLSRTDEHRRSSEAQEPLWTVAVSPSGKLLATGGADRIVRLYDAATGQLLKSLTGHQGAITALQFVGEDRLASTAGDKLVKVWTIASGQAQDFRGHASAVLAVAADASGQLIVAGSVDRTIRAWDAQGKPRWSWLSPSAICALALSKDRQRLFAGLADGQMVLLDLSGSEPKLLHAIAAHGNGVAAISIHPDGSRLATCGGDGYARFWTVSDKNMLTQIGKLDPPSRSGAAVVSQPLSVILYSSDGKQLLSAGAESLVRIVDAQTLNEVRSLRGAADWVTSLALAPDGKSVYAVSVDKVLRAYDITPQDRVSTVGHSQAVKAIAVHPNGTLFATASADGTAKIWNLTTGQEVATLTGSGSCLLSIGFSGTDRVVAGGEDQRLRWWTWQPTREVRSQPVGGPVFSVATASPNQSVAGVWVRDGLAGFELFAASGDTATSQVSEKGRGLSCAALSADGLLAVSGGQDGSLRIWNLSTRERLGADWPIFTNGVADVAFTPDKKRLVAIDTEGTVKVGDVQTRQAGEPIKALSGGVLGLVVSPVADRFVVLAEDGQVKVFGFDGKLLRSWKFSTPANCAAFSPNGKLLLTGQADGTALVLELP